MSLKQISKEDFEKMDIHEAFEQVGTEGRYQKLLIAYFFFQWMIITQFTYAAPMMFSDPKFTCYDSHNKPYTCTDDNNQACAYKQLVPNQMVNLSIFFKWYCEKRYLRTVAKSMCPLGAMILLMIFSFKQFRRKMMFMFNFIQSLFFVIMMLLVQNEYSTLVFYAMAGGGLTFCSIIQYVILSESMSEEYKQIACPFVFLGNGLSQVLLGLETSFITDWRQFMIFFVMIPQIIVTIPLFFMTETPKYSYVSSKVSSTVRLLNRIAKVNGTKPIKQGQLQPPQIQQSGKLYYQYHLLKYRSLRYTFIAHVICIFSIKANYYGITLGASQVGLSLEINLILYGLVESLSYALGTVLVKKLKRKPIIIILGTIIAINQIALSFIQIPYSCIDDLCYQKYIQTSVSTINRLLITLCLCFFYLVILESYPTSIRNIGYGTVKVFGFLGDFSIPYITNFCKFHLGMNQFLVSGIFQSIFVLGVILCQETFQKQIPEDVQEESHILRLSISKSFNIDTSKKVRSRHTLSQDITQNLLE